MNLISKQYLFFLIIAVFLGLSGIHAQQKNAADSLFIGKITQTQLSEKYDWYNKGYLLYTPDSNVLKQLNTKIKGVTFIVVLGTWCSDSKEHVPSFFKVIDLLHIDSSRINMYAIGRKKDRIIPEEINNLMVDLVPTFYVFRNGKMIGKIEEDTKKSMESDLLHILMKKRLFLF